MKKTFIVTIETINQLKEWGYEPNTVIQIPVTTNNKYNAIRKVESMYCGSEYPSYVIRSINECDSFLFQPLL